MRKRTRYDAAVRAHVERMRAEGRTYGQIQAIYPIPRSTLSVWLGKKHQSLFDVESHLKQIREVSARVLRERTAGRVATAEAAARTTANTLVFEQDSMRALLAMLYWAEGTKHARASSLIFVNTDPKLAQTYLMLLRSGYKIREDKLRVRLHLHWYHRKKEAVNYWSRLLGIPATQFGKIHVKKRSVRKKFRKNFMGICFIIYHDSALLREVRALGPAIHERLIPSAGIEPTSHPPQGCILSIELRGESPTE